MNVYLDYAATSPLRQEALEAMTRLGQTFGNPDSLHSFGRAAAYVVTQARDEISSVLGTEAEIYFTSGGTEADNWAMRGLGKGMALVSPIEHAAVLSSAKLRTGGMRLSAAREDGIVSPALLGEIKGAGLVAVMAVNNETGCIQPVAELAERAHACGALFFCDCVQAACSLDLREVMRHADAVSLSAHKLGGPKGVGALAVKKGTKISPLIVGGEQERSMRGGTLNVMGIAGFARAFVLAQEERERFCANTGRLRDLFERKLKEALGEEVRIDGADRAPNISHLTFERGGEAFLNLLDLYGVAASGGAACSAHAAKPSHVLMAMGRNAEEAKRGVRFSFGMQTTEEETLFAVQTVLECLKKFSLG